MTARIEAEDALIREKNFAKNLVETSNAVILLLNPAGQIVHMNPFMEHLTGYALAEISGQDWFDLFIPEDDRDAIRARFFKTVAGHPQDSFIATIITKDQARRVITWSSRRLFQADGLIEEGVLAIGTDVTELKQAEEKLIQSERLAAIGQMVTGLAHESRNALQRSRACLDMLELDVGSNADQLDLVQRIQQALTELQRLYEEVRNYAAPLKLEPEQCDLLSLVRETWELLREHPQHATLQLVCNDSHAASLCYCDQLRLQQVLRNIFENTLAVSPENGQIQVECSPTILFGFSAFELRIQDDGPGLTEEQARRIFDPFYTTKTKGTGLGMAIAKRIIESHGGYISTSPSVPGRGAEIVIVLPQQPILE